MPTRVQNQTRYDTCRPDTEDLSDNDDSGVRYSWSPLDHHLVVCVPKVTQ